jgi:hypothetical protein
MAENAKDKIFKRVGEEGHTDSYATLLYLAAVMGSDPIALGPENSAELTSWSGHLDGLRSSLFCLAMYERQIGPAKAAEVVDQQILDAADDLRPSGAGSAE